MKLSSLSSFQEDRKLEAAHHLLTGKDKSRTEFLRRKKLLFRGTATAAAKSLQSCPTLCDPIDGSPTGSAVPGILQARTLEGVAIAFSNA